MRHRPPPIDRRSSGPKRRDGARPRRVPRNFLISAWLAVLLNAAAALGHGLGLDWRIVLLVWFVSITVAGAIMWGQRDRRRRHARQAAIDALLLAALAIVFSPLYLFKNAAIPFQIGTDEIAMMAYTREALANANPFGLSNYFGFPNLIFLVVGRLATLVGGVSLGPMRMVHAATGIASILLVYCWLRTVMPRHLAIAGAVIFGANHAFLAISRMTFRNNTAVLAELGAVILLQEGLRRDCWWRTFLGGVIGGLAWYSYYSGRAVIGLWLLFLIMLMLRRRPRIAPRRVAAHGLIAAVTAGLVISPLLVATLRDPKDSWAYTRRQILLFPEGRLEQQQHVRAATIAEGIRTNVVSGLLAFVAPLPDRGNLYINPHHGILDPVTRGLLWVGVIGLCVQRFRRQRHQMTAEAWLSSRRVVDAFALTGFAAYWAVFTLVVNKGPYYARLLVICPFIAYLAAEGVRHSLWATDQWTRSLVGRRIRAVPSVCWALGLAAIVIINVATYQEFVLTGFREGHDVGGTARYVMARADRPGYGFYLVANDRYPYYWWGLPEFWLGWFGDFAGPDQRAALLSPQEAVAIRLPAPLTLLMSRACWDDSAAALQTLYPTLRLTPIMPDGSLVAVEAE